MKKNIFLTVLLLVMLCSMVSAAPKVTTITYGRWASMEEAQSFKVLIDTFEKANPDIKVQAEFLPWNAYWDKLRSSIANGTAYDVISFNHLNSAPYISKTVLYDMGKLADAKELLKEMHPGTQAPVMYQGKIYGMPIGVGARALIYNKELFDQAGVPYPDKNKPLTWNEFIQIGKKLTKFDDTGKVIQYASNFNPEEIWEACVIQAGGSFVDNYTQPSKVTVNTPEGITGLEFFADLYRSQINVPFSEQWNGPWGSPDSALNTKKVAIVQSGPWSLSWMLDTKLNIGTAPGFAGKKRATFGYVNFLAMSKETKNAQAAWKFIKWIASAEGQLELAKTGDLPSNSKALKVAKQNPIQYSSEYMDAFYNELPYVITGPMLPDTEFNYEMNNIISALATFSVTPAGAAQMLERQGNAFIQEIFEPISNPESSLSKTKLTLSFSDSEHFTTLDGITSFDGGKSGLFYWRVSNTPKSVPVDFTAKVEVKWDDGYKDTGFGMVFRMTDDQKLFYSFLISLNGYYRLAKMVNGKWEYPVKWQQTDLVKPGTNQLEVTCRDSKIICSLNGKKLIDIKDTSPGSDQMKIGIGANGGVKCSFNNFEVTNK